MVRVRYVNRVIMKAQNYMCKFIFVTKDVNLKLLLGKDFDKIIM